MASLAFCVALAMMTSAISSIAEATDAGDWYVGLGKSETYHFYLLQHRATLAFLSDRISWGSILILDTRSLSGFA